jgi:membrane fusion protein, multidrug efflux system
MSMNAHSSRLVFGHFAVLIVMSPWIAGCDAHRAAEPAPISAAVPVQAASAPPSASVNQPVDAKTLDPNHFTTIGPLVAEQQSDIAAQRDGRVVNIAVEIGDRVKRGQVLASLDDRAWVTAIDSQTARVASLRAQINEWEAEQKMDEADLHRADQMRTYKIISEENWEHVKYKLDEVTAEIARYRADEEAAEADLRNATLQLEQSHVVAPLSGIVGRRSLRLDQEVKKGDVLFWVTAEAPLRVLFTVPESAMASWSVGAPLELTTQDYPALRQRARILRMSPVVDPASDSVQVVGAVEHPSPLLKPGMSMQVSLMAKGLLPR